MTHPLLTKRVTQADPHFCRATLMLIAVSLLAGCAATIVPATQAIEVRLVAEDPAWSGPLECQASNPLGSWQFIAPGTVTVQYSDSPLQITCKAQSGTAAEASPAAPKARSTMQESAKKGYGTGAKVGAGVGVGLGVAAAPVLGPMAIMFVPFSAARGGEIGGLVGAVTSGGRMEYPSPIEVYIRRVSPPD